MELYSQAALSGDERAQLEEDLSIALVEKALGQLIIRSIAPVRAAVLAEMVRDRQTEALLQIKLALDAEELDDAACFRAIEKIVAVLEAAGIPTTRHDFG